MRTNQYFSGLPLSPLIAAVGFAILINGLSLKLFVLLCVLFLISEHSARQRMSVSPAASIGMRTKTMKDVQTILWPVSLVGLETLPVPALNAFCEMIRNGESTYQLSEKFRHIISNRLTLKTLKIEKKSRVRCHNASGNYSSSMIPDIDINVPFDISAEQLLATLNVAASMKEALTYLKCKSISHALGVLRKDKSDNRDEKEKEKDTSVEVIAVCSRLSDLSSRLRNYHLRAVTVEIIPEMEQHVEARCKVINRPKNQNYGPAFSSVVKISPLALDEEIIAAFTSLF